MTIRLLFLFSSLLTTLQSIGQDALAMQLEQGRRKLLLKGMFVSSAWSLGNTVWSISSLTHHPHLENKSFHQMNLAWGGINMVIFGLGTVHSLSRKSYPINLGEGFKVHQKSKKIFRINFILDVVYLATGFGLLIASNQNSHHKTADRLRGFGNSILLQGSYLLVFDGVIYALLKKRDKHYFLP